MSDTRRLLTALLDLAPKLESALGPEWPTTRDALLELVGRIQEGGAEPAVRQALDALLDRVLTSGSPDAQALIRTAMRASAPTESEFTTHRGLDFLSVPGPAPAPPPPAPASEQVPAPGGAAAVSPPGGVVIPVFYGTDRQRTGDRNPGSFYSGTLGTPAFGIARVNVPIQNRKVGELTSPRWWRLELHEDPRKHVILLSVEERERDAFTRDVRESLSAADERDVLLFVHGYNVSFEDAARRAGQMAVDLQFPGRTLLYSWASAADPKQYTVDEETVDVSRQTFEAFLRMALTEIGARDVHVIAHSMGNRAVMNTLERLDTVTLGDGAATLSQVIFAAPDISVPKFQQLAAVFRGRANRYTLYASSRDLALKASKVVHGYARAGEAGDALEIVDGIDTVDASNVDTSLLGLGHSYFGSERSILSDIADLIRRHLPPRDRFALQSAGTDDRRYWSYRE